MSDGTDDSLGIEQEWREPVRSRRQARLQLFARRSLIALLCLVAVATLVILLLRYFSYSQTHVIVLRAAGLAPLSGPTVPVAGNEIELLRALEEVAKFKSGEDCDRLLNSPMDLGNLSKLISEESVGEDDVLILYVAAHGIAHRHAPFLVCNNFDPASPESGLAQLDVVFDALEKSNAKTKLLILDAGQLDYDPRLGILANTFPTHLGKAVADANVPTLSVLCSNSDLQRSHRSYAFNGSVFGVFVAAGLRGAADHDGDNLIGISELEQFVQNGVSEWVGKETAGAASQLPRLLSATGDSRGDATRLLDVSNLPLDVRRLNLRDVIASAHDKKSFSDVLARSGSRKRGYLAHATDMGDENTDSQASADGAPNSGESTDQANAASGATADGGKEQPNPHEQFAQALSRAWRICDRLDSPPGEGATFADRPVDNAPHLWREIQEELVAYEQTVATGSSLGNIPSLGNLQSSIDQLGSAGESASLLGRNSAQLAAHANSSPATAPTRLSSIRSLALAKLLASRLQGVDAKRLQELQSLLDGLIDTAPDELADRIAELPPTPELHRYYELRLITELDDVAAAQPVLAQLALQVRRDGEQTAASAWWSANWLRASIAEADRRRLSGERQMLDQIGADWPERARHDLEAADRLYAAAAQDCRELAEAIHLRNDITFRLPYWLKLQRASDRSDADFQADCAALQSMIDDVRALALLLDNPASSNLEKVKLLKRSIQGVVDGRLADVDAEAASAWQTQQLLETPLPPGQIRSTLAANEQSSAEAIADGLSLAGSLPDDSDSAWRRRREVSRLEASLAGLLQSDDDQPTSLKANQTPATTNDDEQTEPQTEVESIGAVVAKAYGGIPGQLKALKTASAPTTYEAARRQTARANRLIQFLDARDAYEFRDLSARGFSEDLNRYDLLTWYAERCSQACDDASPGELEYLRESADGYTAAANAIFQFPDSPVAAIADIEIQADDHVSLVERPSRVVSVSLRYQGVDKIDAWMVLEYDDGLLDVVAPANVYREAHVPDGFPYRPDQDSPPRPATWSGIPTGETARVNLELRSSKDASRPARFYVKVIARTSKLSGDSTQPIASGGTDVASGAIQIRHAVDVPVRLVDAVVEAPLDSWQKSDDRYVLRTFPNDLTSYRFGVVNRGSVPREISLRFFAAPPGLRLASHSDEEMRNAVGRLTALGKLTISAPADGQSHFAPAEPAPPPVARPAAAQSAQPAEAPAESNPLPTGPRVDAGLILEVSDPKDPAQTFYHQLDIVAQRPRHYVRPQVSYNSRLERIEVVARPRAKSMPPRRPIKISCDIAGDNDAAAEGKLQDVISAPDYAGRLFVNIPANPPREVTLYLNVDDYPRAFIFRVPCGSGVVNQAEQTDVSEVRILSAQKGDFQAPAAVTPIVAQVDAPVGAFDSDDDFLRTALDENMDQQFGPELGLRFDADRAANAYLDRLEPNGVLAIDTRVTDHQVNLATKSLQNVSIQVHGQSVVDGRKTTAQPLTLRIDGAGPRIQSVQVAPWGGFVVAGTDLHVSVLATDAMSGVKQVEVGFDADQTGEFSAKSPPFAATPDVPPGLLAPSDTNSASHTWSAVLPTKDMLGVHTLLVRAVDRADNAGDYFAKRVQILTPEEAAEYVQQQTKAIEGIVIHRGRAVPAATVSLFAVPKEPPPGETPAEPIVEAPPEPIAVSAAGADGSFSLGGVPPGKYYLKAEGVIRNKPRFGEREVVVEPAPGNVIRADLQVE